MLTYPVSRPIENFTSKVYDFENGLAKNHIYIAKGLSPVIAALDICTRSLIDLVQIVEEVALSIINILGSIGSILFPKTLENYNLKDSIIALRYSGISLSHLFDDTIFAVFDFCIQTYSIFMNPQSISNVDYTIDELIFHPKKA